MYGSYERFKQDIEIYYSKCAIIQTYSRRSSDDWDSRPSLILTDSFETLPPFMFFSLPAAVKKTEANTHLHCD